MVYDSYCDYSEEWNHLRQLWLYSNWDLSNVMVCQNNWVYSEKWNGVRVQLYLHWGVESCATANVFTVRSWRICGRFGCTMSSVMGCDSSLFTVWKWKSLQKLLYLKCGLQWCATAALLTVRSGMICYSYGTFCLERKRVRQLWVYSGEWNGVWQLLYLQWRVE